MSASASSYACLHGSAITARGRPVLTLALISLLISYSQISGNSAIRMAIGFSQWRSVHFINRLLSRPCAERCLELCVNSMVGSAKVTQAFRKLVALVARAFYAGEYPPKTPEEIAATSSSRAKQQVEQGRTTPPSAWSRVHVANSISLSHAHRARFTVWLFFCWMLFVAKTKTTGL